MTVPRPNDVEAMAQRYAKRVANDRYSLLRPEVWQMHQEQQRAQWQLWRRLGWDDLNQRSYTEVGCGGGGALLECLQVGFAPERLIGIELLPERHALARRVLPPAVTLHLRNALEVPIQPESQDVVAQHTVFSSLLDDEFQHQLANTMWSWVKPGGGVLWYDFTFDNPRNPDVRGVPLARIRALFPDARFTVRRITLAPPIARCVCRVHPALYTAFNLLPLLRTHLLCWIEK